MKGFLNPKGVVGGAGFMTATVYAPVTGRILPNNDKMVSLMINDNFLSLMINIKK